MARPQPAGPAALRPDYYLKLDVSPRRAAPRYPPQRRDTSPPLDAADAGCARRPAALLRCSVWWRPPRDTRAILLCDAQSLETARPFYPHSSRRARQRFLEPLRIFACAAALSRVRLCYSSYQKRLPFFAPDRARRRVWSGTHCCRSGHLGCARAPPRPDALPNCSSAIRRPSISAAPRAWPRAWPCQGPVPLERGQQTSRTKIKKFGVDVEAGPARHGR